MATPTFSQIKAQVAAIRHKIPQARVIGIHAAGRWTGDRLKQDGPETFQIEQCDSPLQMRMVLQDDDGTATKILITNLDERDLGDDVLVRLTKRRLFPIDSWQIIKTLFQAVGIDPRVTRHGWIADYLLEAIPAEGFAPVPGGFLDAETVWPILLGRQIGFTSEKPDLPALLQWSIDAENVKRFQATPEPFRQTAIEWLTSQAGPAAETVLHCVLCNQRPDALAIGLAAGIVFHREAAGRLDKAAGKLGERYLGGKTPDTDAIHRWYTAATEVVRWRLTDTPSQRAQLHRADDILREVQAQAYAYLSDSSPWGFDQRLMRFGTLLSETVQHDVATSLEALAEARRAILGHDQAQREHQRLDRIEMALRLVRWLAHVHGTDRLPFQSLPEAAAYHLAEGGYIDWARLALRVGDRVQALSEAYACLFEKVTAFREHDAHRFAELLHDWTVAGSTGDQLIPLEHVLDEIVAPLAAQSPVLVIVIDGMSAAVCRELVSDITQQDWVVLCEDGCETNRPGLATIPSITEVSRTSLLCGALRQGNAASERNGFAEHAGLRACCRSGSPPVLFHKPSLQEAGDASLAADVRQEINSSHRRVVGVVVNAVDDHLLKGEQINTHWSRETIKVLPTLLYEAKSARRVVVLLADHGHVLEHHTQGRLHDGGERWRLDDGEPADDEFQMTGSRVVIPDNHRLIAPWSEKVRYGSKKNGYHGGVSPQEMVVPITVLCAGDTFPAGWVEALIDTPAWWDEPLREPEPREEAPIRFKPIKAEPLGPLFAAVRQEVEELPAVVVDVPAEGALPPWIRVLLASPILAEQKKLAGRSVPNDDIIGTLLAALDGHGGKLTSTALARETDYPPLRLRGLLAVLQRMMNIDGYAVLIRDEASDTVELNRDLLLRQFDLV